MRGAMIAVVFLVACRGAGATTVEPVAKRGEAEPPAEARAVAASGEPAPRCPAVASRVEATAAFEEGVALLERSRDGEHFRSEPLDAAFAKLREAAAAGHAKAQALLGSTQFGVMFTNDVPQPEQREAYIESIMWLRTAAIAGEPGAASSMPGLTLAQPPLQEMPLSDVPADWLFEAWRRADAWLACYGLPWTP